MNLFSLFCAFQGGNDISAEELRARFAQSASVGGQLLREFAEHCRGFTPTERSAADQRFDQPLNHNEKSGAGIANLLPGDFVILESAPASLLQGLPEEDRVAIRGVVGKPVLFAGMSFGQAELEFKDARGDLHTIWVESNLIAPAR